MKITELKLDHYNEWEWDRLRYILNIIQNPDIETIPFGDLLVCLKKEDIERSWKQLQEFMGIYLDHHSEEKNASE